MQNDVAAELLVQSVWTGQGGDHLFYQGPTHFGAVDYIRRHGIFSNPVPAIRDAVRLSKMPVWAVLHSAIRFGLLRGDWMPIDELRREIVFVNPEVLPPRIGDYITQPWSDSASDLPNGKRLQICLLAQVLNRHRPLPRLEFAHEYHPLLSQPIMELCLQVPFDILLRGGIDRALARAAFRDCVPDEIIRRVNKGTIATATMTKIRQSRSFIQELLLDGILVRERVVDRSSIEQYVTKNRPLNSHTLWPLLTCTAAEVWARNWEGASSRAAHFPKSAFIGAFANS
jgi:asparagine synthase (glutamine-hydrolysing)